MKDKIRIEAVEILKKSIKVLNDRNKTYGDISNNLKIQSNLWSAYLGIKISEEDVTICYALTKIARIKTGNKYHEDNAIDIANYSSIGSAINKNKRGEKK